MVVDAALAQAFLSAGREKEEGMVHGWFEDLMKKMGRRLRGTQHQINYSAVIPYRPLKSVVESAKSAAKGAAYFVMGRREYDTSKLPECLRRLYDNIATNAGEQKPGIYYVNRFGKILVRAAEILGLYDGHDIYVRAGMDPDREAQTIAHEIMHAYQKIAGFLDDSAMRRQGSMYMKFIEGMAEFFARAYMKAHGHEPEPGAYDTEAYAFGMVYKSSPISRYPMSPQGIREAFSAIRDNLSHYFNGFVGAYTRAEPCPYSPTVSPTPALPAMSYV